MISRIVIQSEKKFYDIFDILLTPSFIPNGDHVKIQTLPPLPFEIGANDGDEDVVPKNNQYSR